MGSFISQPLQVVCRDVEEIRAFLLTCRYVSDREQFGVNDHWMPPEQFELVRQGDCDDFALWTWRQLQSLGYDARFVVGRSGRYGEEHAWVTFRAHDKIFIVESLLNRRPKFPRLETLRYQPSVSVEITDSHVKFFEHTRRTIEPPLRVMAPLIPEWLFFRLSYWRRILGRLVLWPFFAVRRRYRLRKASN